MTNKLELISFTLAIIAGLCFTSGIAVLSIDNKR